ncbi:MAG: hypothetical protein ABI824_12540 [Acidobacteriota bacterium]
MLRRVNKQDAAEWILSLAMPLDRARATVGDLIEDARGPLRFWGGLGQTLGGAVWGSFRAHPLELVGMVILFQILHTVLYYLTVLGGVLVGSRLPFLLVEGLGAKFSLIVLSSMIRSVMISVYVVLISLGCLITFTLARRLASRRPGREFAAAVSLFAFTLFTLLLVRIVDRLGPLVVLVITNPIWPIAAIAGIVTARRRSIEGAGR